MIPPNYGWSGLYALVVAVMFFSFVAAAVADNNATGEGTPEQKMERVNAARDVYHENCAVCHGYDGIPILPVAPNFSSGELLDQSNEELMPIVLNGKGDMPPWKDELSSEQLQDVMAYVRGIAGDQVFQEKCNQCHGRSVPPLSESIPKSRKKLNNYKGPMDLCKGCDVESTMNQNQIIDVIKFLRTMPKQ